MKMIMQLLPVEAISTELLCRCIIKCINPVFLCLNLAIFMI